MLVLTFAVSGRGNCVTVGDLSFVYARTELGSFVMSTRCPHRGGPLHLATVDCRRARLVCPWHGRATPLTSRVLSSSIPVVRRGSTVTAVFDVPADTPHSIGYRPVSDSLAAARDRVPATV